MNATKSLFDRNLRHTDESNELATDVAIMMNAVMAHWMARGYSFREIAHVMQAGVMDAELCIALDLQEVPQLAVVPNVG